MMRGASAPPSPLRWDSLRPQDTSWPPSATVRGGRSRCPSPPLPSPGLRMAQEAEPQAASHCAAQRLLLHGALRGLSLGKHLRFAVLGTVKGLRARCQLSAVEKLRSCREDRKAAENLLLRVAALAWAHPSRAGWRSTCPAGSSGALPGPGSAFLTLS